MPDLPARDAAARDALKTISVGFVALLHAWFFVQETFLWRTSFVQSVLQMSAAEAEATAVLAANQGVYNAVFAVGLVWALRTRNDAVLRFFLISIISVGVYGAISARWIILLVQVLPAVIALALTSTRAASAGSSNPTAAPPAS